MKSTLLSPWEVDYISTRKEKSLCVSTQTFDYVIKNDGTVYNYRHLVGCVVEPKIIGGDGAKRVWR